MVQARLHSDVMANPITAGVCLFAVLVVAAFFLFRKSRPSNAPPVATLGVPIVGTYIEFAKNPVNFIDQCLVYARTHT